MCPTQNSGDDVRVDMAEDNPLEDCLDVRLVVLAALRGLLPDARWELWMPAMRAVGVGSEDARLVLVEGDVLAPAVDGGVQGHLAHVLDVFQRHAGPRASSLARGNLVDEDQHAHLHQPLLAHLTAAVHRADLDEVGGLRGLPLQLVSQLAHQCQSERHCAPYATPLG